MVRIKGSNSDYQYTGDPKTPIQENKTANPLYLKIFICPNDMPSCIEPPHNGHWCEGTDEDCPAEEKKLGHAMICLHQTEGISLITNNTVKAKGSFAVESKGSEELLRVSEEGISFSTKFKDGKTLHLKIAEQEVSLQLGEAKVSITQAGDIELSTPNESGVMINGNLTIQGNLRLNGNIELPEALKKDLAKEIIRSLKKE
ncbi:MAG TPA: hypothetical protein DD379_11045 [Cyanobacteria bacterium UBA11162]|nr:hypothetical protein [Cyanobacteria bacterium UBA11162]